MFQIFFLTNSTQKIVFARIRFVTTTLNPFLRNFLQILKTFFNTCFTFLQLHQYKNGLWSHQKSMTVCTQSYLLFQHLCDERLSGHRVHTTTLPSQQLYAFKNSNQNHKMCDHMFLNSSKCVSCMSITQQIHLQRD